MVLKLLTTPKSDDCSFGHRAGRHGYTAQIPRSIPGLFRYRTGDCKLKGSSGNSNLKVQDSSEFATLTIEDRALPQVDEKAQNFYFIKLLFIKQGG